MKILVVRSEEGEIKSQQLVEGELEQVLKDVVVKALDLWDPHRSDLVVVRHKHEVSLQLPITREQYELYSRFSLRRFGDKAIFEIPVYIVSFDNEWTEDNIRDSRVFIVAPYIDEATTNNIIELAKNVTSVNEVKETETEEEENVLEEE